MTLSTLRETGVPYWASIAGRSRGRESGASGPPQNNSILAKTVLASGRLLLPLLCRAPNFESPSFANLRADADQVGSRRPQRSERTGRLSRPADDHFGVRDSHIII